MHGSMGGGRKPLTVGYAVRQRAPLAYPTRTQAAIAEGAGAIARLIPGDHQARLRGEPTLADRGAGQPKRTKAQNPLLRLDQRETEVMRFAHDFRVPFDNNLSERDLRMVKLQHKISGCWRTTHGAERFLAIRSYLSTARKRGQRPLDVLAGLAAGQPWLPTPVPG